MARCLEIHRPPNYGSGMKLAEIELSVLSGQCLRRGLPHLKMLWREVAAWDAGRNQRNASINWQFTANGARIKLKSLYPSR